MKLSPVLSAIGSSRDFLGSYTGASYTIPLDPLCLCASVFNLIKLRDGDPEAIAVYDSHGRLHGHVNHDAAVEAVADAAYAGLVEGR